MSKQYILRHDFNCSHNKKICAWDDFDYSDPKTNLIKHLEPETIVKVIKRKFPGILVELKDGSQYWVCKWDVHYE